MVLANLFRPLSLVKIQDTVAHGCGLRASIGFTLDLNQGHGGTPAHTQSYVIDEPREADVLTRWRRHLAEEST